MIGVVGCSNMKRSEPCAAKDLYVGQLFIKSKQLFELMGIKWVVLSAKHGLVMPDQIIEPYNVTLNTMGAKERRAWVNSTREQLEATFPKGTVYYATAGVRYREALEPFPHHAPLRGLGIGEQLAELNRLIDKQLSERNK